MKRTGHTHTALRAFWIGLAALALLLPLVIQPVDVSAQEAYAAEDVDVAFTLRTTMEHDPPMAFIGVGGDIDGVVNPELRVEVGQTVRITVINGDPVWHDLVIDEFGVSTGELLEAEQVGEVVFTAEAAGEYTYYCSVPGHREIGMLGKLVVVGEGGEEAAEAEGAVGEDIVRDPKDIPPPVGDRGPETVQVVLATTEVVGQLADGTTLTYWTFNGTVPGPMIRVREGDTVEVLVHNPEDSQHVHSIDLHAVTGPGGGAVYTQTAPGEETRFTFKALQPGLYVYHCATPSVANHIANGMYGLILVEPEGGLPEVDHEFYVMQGEIYTQQEYGTTGHLDFDYEAMLDEDPEYLVFNGAAGALTSDEYALRANVGESVRIYFGVGGPNYTSSFHVIGEILDRVYDQASLTAPPLTDVQTTTVAPGGATVVELTLDVPGRYILVDHALSRLERGLAGYLYAEGEENHDIFHGEAVTEDSGH